jgi:Cft2 family RNA processing exonuclease
MQNGPSRELFELWAPDSRNGLIITGYSIEGTLARVSDYFFRNRAVQCRVRCYMYVRETMDFLFIFYDHDCASVWCQLSVFF